MQIGYWVRGNLVLDREKEKNQTQTMETMYQEWLEKTKAPVQPHLLTGKC